MYNRISTKDGLIILVLCISLLVTLSQLRAIRYLLGEASGRKADIVITNQQVETIKPIWKGMAQGYESEPNMFADIIPQTQDLNLQIIRIDHIFDSYNLITRTESGIELDFTQIDQVVDSILETGAQPAFALSYMPPTLAQDNNVTNQPTNWNEWEFMITEFIKHYSSPEGRNLQGLYYEVWNEPDLFGNWHYGTAEKNYLNLYQRTSNAAIRGAPSESFYLGGPVTTALYPNWIKALLDYSIQNELKLDFISWHRYDTDINKFTEDATWLNQYLAEQNRTDLQLIISEWGPDSEVNPIYDDQLAAAHAIAVIRELIDKVDWVWAFELKDGLHPEGKQFWGRWGMMTHPDTGLAIKPRYQAWELLNQLEDQRAFVFGEGTWVKALSSTTGDKITTILVNYDPQNIHIENVPLTIKELEPGQYQWTTRHLIRGTETDTVTVEDSWQTQIYMPPNSVVLVELQRLIDSQQTP